MNNINGGRVWCRTTEEKIIEAFLNGVSKKISIRDSIIAPIHLNKKVYRLWNTDLVKKLNDDVFIYIATNQEEIDRYCSHWNYQRRDYIISNTTKSRLNAFLSYYDFGSLEVHSSMKDWSVKFKGKELKLDSWYKLDFEKKELVLQQ